MALATTCAACDSRHNSGIRCSGCLFEIALCNIASSGESVPAYLGGPARIIGRLHQLRDTAHTVLMNHYCSDDCLRRDEALHRQSCHKMAVVGFKMKFDVLQGMTPFTLQFLYHNNRSICL